MDRRQFQTITSLYPRLRVAVLGDLCLDRYLEIDPTKEEVSIETGLPVHNVLQVRAQPGGAGTILNNLSALGVGTIYPIGFVGDDGEGFELCQALGRLPGVRQDGVVRTAQRRTFTYCKPLVLAEGKPPVELNRLDSKNWTPTPPSVEHELLKRLTALGDSVDAVIVLDQVDIAETGVVTRSVLQGIGQLAAARPEVVILADSRRGLQEFPPVIFKMNAAELARLSGAPALFTLPEVEQAAVALAGRNGRRVFVTLAEKGILGADPAREIQYLPALPTRGEIDVVGAGDAVSANLAAALAAGARLNETLELANAAASVVVHKLGTTGTATVSEISQLLPGTH